MSEVSMPAVLGTFIGILYSVMNLFNAQLSQLYGNTFAAVIIHTTGLVIILPFAAKQLFKKHNAPLIAYLGGFLGIFTVFTSNIGIAAIGVTATLSLTLLGQLALSMVFDQFGLWGFAKIHFKMEKAVSLVLIALGVAVMLIW
jgi:bacterial/archaeal transporter family-2 protein